MVLVEGVKSPDACRSSKDTGSHCRARTRLQASARPARGDPVSFVVQQLTFFHFSAADFFILQQLALIIKSTKLI
jgi:hypothetical protein